MSLLELPCWTCYSSAQGLRVREGKAVGTYRLFLCAGIGRKGGLACSKNGGVDDRLDEL